MSKFNLKKAKEGAVITTRSGKEVKILLFDRSSTNFPLVAILENKEVLYYTDKGRFYTDKESDKDLLIK